MKKISRRLKAIISKVIEGTTVVDIGTDHAYLPIYLVTQKICPRVIGIELNPGPLNSAKRQVESAGLTPQIIIREGNGLKAIQPGEVHTVVIAGIGGSTICEILESGHDVLATSERLILQPMGAVVQVRRWLLEHSWQIIDEDLIKEDGFFYIILTAEPNENKGYKINEYSSLELMVGPGLIQKKHPLLLEYLKYLIKREEKIFSQLNKSYDARVLKFKEEKQKYLDDLNRLKASMEEDKRGDLFNNGCEG